MIAHDQKYLEDNKYEELNDQSRKISAMLSNFIGYLTERKFKERA